MTNEEIRFDEKHLREELIRVWGEAGAHVDLYDTILANSCLNEEIIQLLDKSLRVCINALEPYRQAYENSLNLGPQGTRTEYRALAESCETAKATLSKIESVSGVDNE